MFQNICYCGKVPYCYETPLQIDAVMYWEMTLGDRRHQARDRGADDAGPNAEADQRADAGAFSGAVRNAELEMICGIGNGFEHGEKGKYSSRVNIH